LTNSHLLLKDPSNVWRLSFWKKFFCQLSIKHLILARDPRETINGLCDGWCYPYGYQTVESPEPLMIHGYSERGEWQKHYVNYSTSSDLWKILGTGLPVHLEVVAAMQWVTSYRALLPLLSNRDALYLKSPRSGSELIGFEWIKTYPIAAFQQICRWLEIPFTSTLHQAALNLKTKPVQVTPGTGANGDRWKNSARKEAIEYVSHLPWVIQVAKELGYMY
jgi:hypothetical protein